MEDNDYNNNNKQTLQQQQTNDEKKKTSLVMEDNDYSTPKSRRVVLCQWKRFRQNITR